MFEYEEKVLNLINFDQKKFSKLKKYVDLIIQKNKEFNLTGFNEELIWKEGIYQSIFILNNFIDLNQININLLDIGAGVGFPSIPFFIFSNQRINLTIYEPIKKRVNFLNQVKQELNLKNIFIINKRVEEAAEEEKYNYICARAVMNLNMLIEVSSKVGAINCKYIFLKSQNAIKEIKDSKWIIKQLDIKDLKVNQLDINDNKIHNIVTYNKQVKTPNSFPRKWYNIKKQYNNDK